MAFSVRVSGVPKVTSAKGFSLELDWWDPFSVLKHPGIRFIATNETGSYKDYNADLSPAQMKGLYEAMRPSGFQGSWALAEPHEAIRREIETLDMATGERIGDYSKFLVNVFEWESGL